MKFYSIFIFLIIGGFSFSQQDNSIAYNYDNANLEDEESFVAKKQLSVKLDSSVQSSISETVVLPSTSEKVEVHQYMVPDFSMLTCFGDEFDSSKMEKLTQIPAVGTILNASDTLVRVFVAILDSASKINTGDFNIRLKKGQALYVPQFISPNNDNVNDTWEIPNLSHYSENRVKLYDKYGKMILDLKNYKGGWNGVSNVLKNKKCKNVIIPNGKYFYTIQLDDNKKAPLYGCLTIKR